MISSSKIVCFMNLFWSTLHVICYLICGHKWINKKRSEWVFKSAVKSFVTIWVEAGDNTKWNNQLLTPNTFIGKMSPLVSVAI